MRVPVPELEGHAAGASLGCPVRWLEAVSVRDPPPCPTTAPAVSTGGRAAPADWLQLRGRPSRHAGRGGQRVFIRPLA